MSRAVAIVLAGLGFLTVAQSAAAQRPFGAPPSAQDQVEPVIATLDTGQVVFWSQNEGAGGRILARSLHRNGLPVGGPSERAWEVAGAVSPDGVKGDQRWPAVSSSRYLVWSEKAAGATDYDLYLQLLDNYGRPQRAPMLIAGGPGDQLHADVYNGCGMFFVAWADDRDDHGAIYGRWFDYGTLQPEGEEILYVRSPGWADEPEIDFSTLAHRQKLQIYFTDDRDGNRDIFVTTVSSDLRVAPTDPTAHHEPVVSSPEDDYAPDVVGVQTTRGALLWTHDSVTDGPDLWLQKLGPNGLLQGKPTLLAGGPGTQAVPSVDGYLTPDGPGFDVAWQDDRGGTLDVLGVDVGGNLRASPHVRVLASD